MKLYMISRTEDIGYDEYDSFVIAAESQEQARQIAADANGDEGRAPWLDSTRSICREIDAKSEKGIVLRSFQAG